MVTEAMKLKDTAPWMKSYDKRRPHFKKRQYFADKGLSNQNFDLSSGHVWM